MEHSQFPVKGKKLLVVGPPDSGKTSWFTPFQGILINTDLLLSSEKVTAMFCLGILFTRFYEILLKVILEQGIVT